MPLLLLLVAELFEQLVYRGRRQQRVKSLCSSCSTSKLAACFSLPGTFCKVVVAAVEVPRRGPRFYTVASASKHHPCSPTKPCLVRHSTQYLSGTRRFGAGDGQEREVGGPSGRLLFIG